VSFWRTLNCSADPAPAGSASDPADPATRGQRYGSFWRTLWEPIKDQLFYFAFAFF
jgi:hypothetical protein